MNAVIVVDIIFHIVEAAALVIIIRKLLSMTPTDADWMKKQFQESKGSRKNDG